MAGTGAPFDPDEVGGLPEPVRRFFLHALAPGARVVEDAVVRQEGEILLRPPALWRPFRAVQRFTTSPPGFRWDARVRAPLGLPVTVRDAFADGRGSVRARLLGLVTLASAGGTPEVATASLQRYLAEAVLLPTALLPREGVAWSALGGDRARATLATGGVSASVQFEMAPDGAVRAAFVPDRPRDLGGGRTERTPWRGSWRDEVVRDGMRVPSWGEAAWLLPAGPLAYWRARVVSWACTFR